MKALRMVAVALGVTLAALIVIPLIVLAGLFVWLKLTEEADEEALELEQEGGRPIDTAADPGGVSGPIGLVGAPTAFGDPAGPPPPRRQPA